MSMLPSLSKVSYRVSRSQSSFRRNPYPYQLSDNLRHWTVVTAKRRYGTSVGASTGTNTGTGTCRISTASTSTSTTSLPSCHVRLFTNKPTRRDGVTWLHNCTNRGNNLMEVNQSKSNYYITRQFSKRSRATQLKLEARLDTQQFLELFQSTLNHVSERPVLTEPRAIRDGIWKNLHLADKRHHPKTILSNARMKLGFQQNIQIFESGVAFDNIHSNDKVFLATYTITFPYGSDILQFMTQPHPHLLKAQASSPTSVCIICTGAATSKKKAEMLAAADVLVLLGEIGIDAKNPPNLKEERAARAKESQEYQTKIFEADLVRARLMLEFLHCSKPKYVHEPNGSGWTASVSLFLRGQRLVANGKPAPSKKKAEGSALIAMTQSDELRKLVGSDALDIQHRLIQKSPGGRITSIRLPPLQRGFLEEIHQILIGMDEKGDERRLERHKRLKKKSQNAYERALAEEAEKYKKLNDNRGTAINAVDEALKREEEQRNMKAVQNPNGKEAVMRLARDALPIKKIQKELTEFLKTRQVVVVSGGTGSGKSTQCPQYILEDAIANGKGASTKIVVSQPRKIAAISVAERVAAERCESIGNSVGYAVRFKRKAPRDEGGSVEFVTTGVLLRRLMKDSSLSGVSHVMIDEVHERDISTDFLLVLIRDLLKDRPDLRVILMSATMDAQSISDYFSAGFSGGSQTVPLLSVPTQPRHPVEVYYLEDLATTATDGLFAKDMRTLAKKLLDYNDKQLRAELEEALDEEEVASEVHAMSQAEDEGETFISEDYNSASEIRDYESAQSNTSTRVDTLRRALSFRKLDSAGRASDSKKGLPDRFDPTSAVVELVTKLASHICQEEIEAGRSGSILCFLPGWDEISASMKEMQNTELHLKDKIAIFPLHSSVAQEDQQKVFQPAGGKVKVILATNIAESSVTIDDVLAVVDSGLVRELNYDAERAMTAMETNKTSRASATQRLGRAGRVAPGKCYRLYSRGDFEAMAARPTPEIQRTALETTCLHTSAITTKGVKQFLRRALDPPPEDSVSSALDRLVKLGAIHQDDSGREMLSPLGRCLSRLPLDPAVGRMLIMGVVMKALDPSLTAAACLSSRAIFYNPPDLREDAREIRKSFSNSSDVSAMVKAYNTFWYIVENGGWSEARNWANDSYLSVSAIVSVKAVRMQLLDELKRQGMVPSSEGRTRRGNTSLNANANNRMLYEAIWALAFHSNLAGRSQLGSFGKLRTSSCDHARIHPSSVAFHRAPPRGSSGLLPSWYSYREMVLSSEVFLRDVIAVEPEQIMLFGGYSLDRAANSSSTSSYAQALIDDWIAVKCSCTETVKVFEIFRNEIIYAMEHKAMFPRDPLPVETQDILDAICTLIDPDEFENEQREICI